ncbi:hypothetical protein GCM10023080_033630 [Streptomyces pseudoechinosporeus]
MTEWRCRVTTVPSARRSWRALGCFKHAVLVLCWFIDGTRIAQLAVQPDAPMLVT